jgi:hypothetical protein
VPRAVHKLPGVISWVSLVSSRCAARVEVSRQVAAGRNGGPMGTRRTTTSRTGAGVALRSPDRLSGGPDGAAGATVQSSGLQT